MKRAHRSFFSSSSLPLSPPYNMGSPPKSTPPPGLSEAPVAWCEAALHTHALQLCTDSVTGARQLPHILPARLTATLTPWPSHGWHKCVRRRRSL